MAPAACGGGRGVGWGQFPSPVVSRVPRGALHTHRVLDPATPPSLTGRNRALESLVCPSVRPSSSRFHSAITASSGRWPGVSSQHWAEPPRTRGWAQPSSGAHGEVSTALHSGPVPRSLPVAPLSPPPGHRAPAHHCAPPHWVRWHSASGTLSPINETLSHGVNTKEKVISGRAGLGLLWDIKSAAGSQGIGGLLACGRSKPWLLVGSPRPSVGVNREGAQFTSGGRGCFSLQSSERQSLVRTAPGCHGTGSTSSSPGLAEPRLAVATCRPRFGRKNRGCATLLVLGARPGRMGLFSVIQKHLPCVRPWPAPCIPSLLPSSSSISQTGRETRAGLWGAEGAASGWGEADGFVGSQGGWSGKMRPGWRWPKGGVTRVFSPWPGTPPSLIPQAGAESGRRKGVCPESLSQAGAG